MIASRRGGIEAETLYLVPLGETLEVWRTRVTNHATTQPTLSLFGAVEFCLWDAWDDQTNLQRNLSTGEVEVHDGVIYHTTEYRERRNHFAYFACSEPSSPASTPSARAFLGPYRGWDRPLAVERGTLRRLDRPRLGADRLAPRRARALEPGETREVVFVLGLRGEPGRLQVRPARLAQRSTRRACAR